jgi:hypothetical protein
MPQDKSMGGRYEVRNSFKDRLEGAAYSNKARVDTNSKDPEMRFQELGMEAKKLAASKASARSKSKPKPAPSMRSLLKMK